MAKSGRHYTFRNYEFWAADGMIAILDTDKAGSSQLSVEEATKWVRPKEFLENAMAARVLLDETNPAEGRKLLEDAHACFKEAIRQGDISNPKILHQRLEEARPIRVSTAGLFIPQRSPQQRYIDRLRKLEGKKVEDIGKVLTEGVPELRET
jgi:hypothetical protein